jgi:hypothetical protein
MTSAFPDFQHVNPVTHSAIATAAGQIHLRLGLIVSGLDDLRADLPSYAGVAE